MSVAHAHGGPWGSCALVDPGLRLWGAGHTPRTIPSHGRDYRHPAKTPLGVAIDLDPSCSLGLIDLLDRGLGRAALAKGQDHPDLEDEQHDGQATKMAIGVRNAPRAQAMAKGKATGVQCTTNNTAPTPLALARVGKSSAKYTKTSGVPSCNKTPIRKPLPRSTALGPEDEEEDGSYDAHGRDLQVSTPAIRHQPQAQPAKHAPEFADGGVDVAVENAMSLFDQQGGQVDLEPVEKRPKADSHDTGHD